MARIAYGPLVTNISGKVGNVVFSKKGNSSPYIKTLQTKTTNPSSVNQNKARSYFSAVSKGWEGLSASQQAVWTDAEKNGYGKRTDSGGGAQSIIHANKGKGGGKGLYMYCNVNVLSCGGTLLLTAPVTPAVIPASPAPIAASFTSGTLTVTYLPGLSGLKVRPWIVGVGKNLHRQTNLVSAATSGVITKAQYFAAKGVLTPWGNLLGQKIYVQLEIIDPASGLASNPSNTVEATVA